MGEFNKGGRVIPVLRPICLSIGLLFANIPFAQAGFFDWLTGGAPPDILNQAERDKDKLARLELEEDLSKPKVIGCSATRPSPEQMAKNPFFAMAERLGSAASGNNAAAPTPAFAAPNNAGGAPAPANPPARKVRNAPDAKLVPVAKSAAKDTKYSYFGGRAPCYTASGNVVMKGGDMMHQLVDLRERLAMNKVGQVLNTLSSQLNGGASLMSNQVGNTMDSLGGVVADAAIDYLITQMSMWAIENMMATLMDDPRILNQIEVEMPDASALPPDMQMRIKMMGAYLTVIKAANLVLGTGQRSFYLAKESYRDVIVSREERVKVLGQGRFARDGLVLSRADLEARGDGLEPDDLEYFSRFEGKKFEEFLKDGAATEMVAGYLQKRDPANFQEVNLKQAEMRSHHDAYARAVAGAASTLGFTAMFLRNTQKIISSQKAEGAKVMLPLIEQGLTEVISLAPRVTKVLAAGDGIYEGTFVIEKDGKVVRRGLTGTGVFDAMDEETREQLRRQLITPEAGKGMLAKLYTRSPDLALEFADSYSSKETRMQYAKDTISWDDTDFTFKNSLPVVDKAKRKQMTSVLQVRYTPEDAGMEAAAKLQKEMIDTALKKMKNEQVRHLMFASAKEGAATSSLKVGTYTVRIETPGVSGVADYERFGMANIKTSTVRVFENPDRQRWDGVLPDFSRGDRIARPGRGWGEGEGGGRGQGNTGDGNHGNRGKGRRG